MSDEANAVQLAEIGQIVKNIKDNVDGGFSRVEKSQDELKADVKALDKKFEKKIEMSNKEIRDLDKRVGKNEDFRKTATKLIWVVVGIILAAATYAGIQTFVDYVNTYGTP